MLLRKGASILRQPDSPPDEGNGGSSKPMSEEDVGRIVNAAVTSQLNRALPKVLGDALGKLDLKAQIADVVKELVPAPQAPAPDEGDGKGKSKPGSELESKLQKQLEAIATELENEKKARQEAERARTEAETQRKRDAALQAFRSGVSDKVKPDLLDVFTEHFGSRRLKIDEEGNALFTVRRAPYKGAPEEDADLPLSEALPHFLSSKDVQPFLPAPGGQQGGDGRGTQRRPVPRVPGADANDSDKAEAALAALGNLGVDPSSLL